MSAKTKTKAAHAIRTPQYRCLKALAKPGTTLTRTELAARAGFTPTSGTINRALHGIGKGSSSGDPFPGLLEMGLVDFFTVELDGNLKETRYRATAAGRRAAQAFAKLKKVGKV